MVTSFANITSQTLSTSFAVLVEKKNKREPQMILTSLILLQIVMVSPGTHFVKNHEFQSRTSESQLKNNESEIENAWGFM